jgi:hypothetical protein
MKSLLPSAASILGYLPEELQRKSIYDFEPEDHRRIATWSYPAFYCVVAQATCHEVPFEGKR